MLIWKTCEKRKFDLHLQSSFNGLWNGAKSLEIKLNWKQNVSYFLDMVLFCSENIVYAVTRICSVKRKSYFVNEWLLRNRQSDQRHFSTIEWIIWYLKMIKMSCKQILECGQIEKKHTLFKWYVQKFRFFFYFSSSIPLKWFITGPSIEMIRLRSVVAVPFERKKKQKLLSRYSRTNHEQSTKHINQTMSSQIP